MTISKYVQDKKTSSSSYTNTMHLLLLMNISSTKIKENKKLDGFYLEYI